MADRQSSPGIPPDDHHPGAAAPERTRSTTSAEQQQGDGRRGSDSVEPAGRPAKRRKESHVRSRVSRACDRCKSRKTRCSGKYPCTLCSQLGLDCQYEAAYTRGRLPSIEIETDDRVLQMAAHARRQSSATVSGNGPPGRNGEDGAAAGGIIPIPSPISIEHHQLSDRLAGEASLQQRQRGTASTAQSSRNSPEPSQNDQQGHYVGPASGASFLLRIQRKLVHQQSLSSESSIFTFGDLPLPEFDPSFFILPPQADAEALLARKRTFWCAYNLDTYLSAALGRPRTFHDEDIDQDFPTCVNDSDLHNRQMHPSAVKSQSLMSGPIAHFKLSRILANILRDLYGIKPPSSDDRYRLAAKYNDELNEWRTSLAYLLDTDGVDPSLFLPIFLRQRNVLNLAFWHAQILVHRPFLLSNFAGLTNYSINRSKLSGNSKLAYHVQRCLDAAMNIVRVVDDLTNQSQIYSTYWFTHYFAFCAVVVLYVYTIQQRHSSPEYYLPHFRAAAKCQEQISNIATKGSLAERYGVVLQELRLEILRHNEFLATQGASAATMPLLGSDLVFLDQGAVLGSGLAADGLQQMGHDAFAEASPSSSIAQLTGWGQFDSLVTGGIGSLETLLADSAAGWDLDLDGGLGGIA
ncbi:hypothetical protein SLS57_011661 [Botryosphaeria dothidea]